MQFLKKVYTVYSGVWSKAPEAQKCARIFVLKVTLQYLMVLLTVSYKKWGSRMYTASQKKGDTILLSISLLNIDRFS